MNDLKKAMIEFVESCKKKEFQVNDLYAWLEVKNRLMFDIAFSSHGRAIFLSAINELVSDNVIEPVKSSPSMSISNGYTVKSRYRILSAHEQSNDTKDALEAIKHYDRRIPSIRYYKNNPTEYLQDKVYIDIIYDFLGEIYLNPNMTPLTVHERSWQLFQDEKFIKNSGGGARGAKILSNLGLTHEDLNCYTTYEPFVFYKTKDFDTKEFRNILVVENKDSFWSLKKIIENPKSKLEIDMIIYGEGNKIVKSLQYLESIGGLFSDKIHYFGDIDREGVNIFARLKQEYLGIFNLEPSTTLYEHLFDGVNIDALNGTKKAQKQSDNAIEMFGSTLPEELFLKIKSIIENEKYIPQEALNYEKMVHLFLGEDQC